MMAMVALSGSLSSRLRYEVTSLMTNDFAKSARSWHKGGSHTEFWARTQHHEINPTTTLRSHLRPHISTRRFPHKSANMENDKGELVDLYVTTKSHESGTKYPCKVRDRNATRTWKISTNITCLQLRPKKVQRYQQNYQGQGPRIRSDLRWKGRWVWSLHRWEPSLRSLRFRSRNGRVRRLFEPIGTKRWSVEECLERKQPKINV